LSAISIVVFLSTATGGEGLSIRAKGYTSYSIAVSREGSKWLRVSGLAHIPYSDFTLSAISIVVFLSTTTGGEGLSIRAKGYATYQTAVSRKGSKG
jgi:hypothetical protein